MQTRRPGPPTLLVAAAALLVGCGSGDDSTAKKPEPAPPATTATASRPAKAPPVELYISANHSVRPVVSPGWPIVVQVRVVLAPGAGDALALSNPAGTWADALKLECVGPGNVDRSALFSPVVKANKAIALTRERSGLMVWVLDGAAPQSLPEGTWQMRAVLDEKKLGNAVGGGVRSNAISVVVVASPAVLTPRAAQRKCLATMTALAWKGDAAQALAAATAHLTNNPEDVAVLFMKGQVLRSQGKKAEAMASFEAALAAAIKDAEKMSENFAIEEAIGGLQREMAGP